MHLYLFVRGKFTQVEEWKAHAQAAYWKFRRINGKTGEEETILVQGALRPSVMGAYEYVFPREALTEVCAFFGIKDAGYKFGNLKAEKLRLAVLRKIFQAKKIPKDILKKAAEMPSTFSTAEFERGCSNCIIPGIGLHAIGIKEDEYRYFPEFDYTQEAL